MIRQPEPRGEDAHRRFPAVVFHKRLQDIVLEYVNALQLNIDFVSTALLAALSTAIGSSFKIRVQERHNEPAILWAVLVGSPGTKKTPTLSHLFEPIIDIGNDAYKVYQADFERYMAEGARGTKPVFTPSWLKTFTWEALTDNLRQNPKGICVLPDEMLSLLNNLNRYNKGSDEDLLLDLHSGKGINNSRKCSDPIYVKETNVNLAAGTQPERIKALMTEHRKASGLAYRLIFAYPQDAKATPMQDTYQFDIDKYEDYAKIIRQIHEKEPISKALEMDPDARKLYLSWNAQNVAQINEMNQTGSELSTLCSKYECYIARFALVLQISSDICNGKEPSTITKESIENAIKLHGYYYQTAVQVLGLSERHPQLQCLKDWQYQIYRDLPDSFTRKQAQDYCDKAKIEKSQKTIDDFLADPRHFRRKDHGTYEKRVKA